MQEYVRTVGQLDSRENGQGKDIVYNVSLGESIGNHRVIESTTITAAVNPHPNNSLLKRDHAWKDLQRVSDA
jgi:hypothetical protein